MDLYEYQGKQLFARFGIPVPDGVACDTPVQARAAAEQLGGRVAVKAQVLVGGRGKAGGIRVADTPDEAEQHAQAILGLDIRGHIVRKLWIERASDIADEYYFSITFDRGAKRPLAMLTSTGWGGHRAGGRRVARQSGPGAHRPAGGLPAAPRA